MFEGVQVFQQNRFLEPNFSKKKKKLDVEVQICCDTAMIMFLNRYITA